MTSINSTTIKIKRDPAATWTANNKTLSLGEPGIESDTHKMKIGDGSTLWNDLPYTSDGNYVSFQTKRDTAANLASNNPIIEVGEIGLETDTRKTKYGNGSSNWNDLPYSTCPVDGSEVSLQVMRDTETNWTANTTPLLSGQLVYDTDTGATKIGDGSSLWDSLPDLRDQFQTIVTVRKTGKGEFSCANPKYSTDAQCIQAALDHISSLGGGVLHIEKGHYICDSQLLYTGSNLIIDGHGENTILDFSTAQYGLWCLYIHGNITTTNSTLAADVHETDLSLTTASGTVQQYSPGDWIRIRSEAIFNGWTQHVGEIQQISSIENDVISLNERVFGEYLITDAATIDKINMVSNIVVKNLKMTATNSNFNFGITVGQAENVKVENVSLEDFRDRAIYYIDVVAGSVNNCMVKRSNSIDLGYGVAVSNASRDICVNNNKFYDCRHGLICGGDHTYGIQYNQIYTANSQSHDSPGQGMFGMHNTYNGIVISNNTVGSDGLGYFAGVNHTISVNNLYNVSRSAGVRIVSTAKGFTIIGNTIVTKDDQDAISIFGPASDVLIIGNIINSAHHGIYTEYEIENVKISNNSIISELNGIYLRDTAASASSSNINIENNNIKAGAAGISIMPYAYDYSHIKITGNTIIGCSSSSIELWPNSTGHKFTDIKIDENKITGGCYGVTCAACDDVHVKGNKINNSYVGIYIRDMYTNCSDYVISQNKINNTTTAIDDESGIGIISDNDGYKTENTGTATIPASTTSIVVNHDLVSTPTRYSVTPSANIGNCWIDTITATQMTIHCSTAPETDTVVSWSA